MNIGMQTEKTIKTIVIDGKSASTSENTVYDGLGFISANNSSRLLMDYKTEHEDAYWEILNYMFGEEGLHMSLIKIEMGADVDSSSGTEPAFKRTLEEQPDATRGAGPMLAADALSINPNIAVDMLYWGIPAWVSNAADENAAFYLWYKSTIEALYDQYGIRLSYLTVGRNEREIKPELIKYVARALKEEKNARYDYSKIQIVAGEGVTDWKIADAMLEDSELLAAVDVISSHYTSFVSEHAKLLQEKYGKKVWFSEGSSPMKSARLTSGREEKGNGISGINGCLDIASRITQAIAEGMTMYEFQPAVSAYYDGATYFPKQLITANEPWSGAYTFDVGFYMGLHFASVFPDGMYVIRDACYGDGKAGGDGHAVVGSTYNYATMTDREQKDFSTVFVNTTGSPITYRLKVSNVARAKDGVHVFLSEENKGVDYYASFFENKGSILPKETEEGYLYTVVVPAYSMVSVTTLDVPKRSFKDRRESKKLLALPYYDDFRYAGYEDDYLKKRGNAPRYTTDEGGAFEVAAVDGENVLMQQISAGMLPTEWGATAEPTTNFGDDTWKDYSVSVEAHFAKKEDAYGTVNYVGAGIRYNLADDGMSGYQLRLDTAGRVSLYKGGNMLAEAQITVDTGKWYVLRIDAVDNRIDGYIDGEKVLTYADTGIVVSGRAALYSSYQKNYFKNLAVSQVKDSYTVTRIDAMDASLVYSKGSSEGPVSEGNWYFETLSSFKNYNRTKAEGTAGCELSFGFNGTGFSLLGICEGAELSVQVDDGVPEKATAAVSSYRQSFFDAVQLNKGRHRVTVCVLSGCIHLDVIETY